MFHTFHETNKLIKDRTESWWAPMPTAKPDYLIPLTGSPFWGRPMVTALDET